MSDSVETHAAKIRASLGKPEPSNEERAKRRRIFEAQRTAAICAECGHSIASSEPVWRKRLSLGPGFFGGWRYTVAPVCGDCRGGSHIWYREPTPCEGCGRPTAQRDNGRSWRHTFCCCNCKSQYYNDIQRQRRALARDKMCAACGQQFTATRSDARTCSPACRQKAYRKRVTDNEGLDGRGRVTVGECRAAPTFNIRNAAQASAP